MLCEFGFTIEKATEAYKVSNNNMEAATNYLFDDTAQSHVN